jgi:hypothetical protein
MDCGARRSGPDHSPDEQESYAMNSEQPATAQEEAGDGTAHARGLTLLAAYPGTVAF